MTQNEIVEVSAASNDRKTNRRVLVASLSIQKVRLNIYQDAERVSIILCTFENPSLYEMLT
ncbi:hypothetical protein PO185_07630 [Limosilactobacillus mucosae]|uniref:hypothetical protein n=1 Tax=Limosilactobacillus mucosae TaxID=97478 RepID=UPI00233F6637|nr:hypothetical protein [Limosilactobacillus mucosae]MDC2845512.1 hypothetical protein [Limosilactobacillus mucosae]